jgi:hypothetical protein
VVGPFFLDGGGQIRRRLAARGGGRTAASVEILFVGLSSVFWQARTAAKRRGAEKKLQKIGAYVGLIGKGAHIPTLFVATIEVDL